MVWRFTHLGMALLPLLAPACGEATRSHANDGGGDSSSSAGGSTSATTQSGGSSGTGGHAAGSNAGGSGGISDVSNEAHLCYSKMLTGYALGRDIVESDEPLLEELSSVSRADSLKHVILALVNSPAFYARREAP